MLTTFRSKTLHPAELNIRFFDVAIAVTSRVRRPSWRIDLHMLKALFPSIQWCEGSCYSGFEQAAHCHRMEHVLLISQSFRARRDVPQCDRIIVAKSPSFLDVKLASCLQSSYPYLGAVCSPGIILATPLYLDVGFGILFVATFFTRPLNRDPS